MADFIPFTEKHRISTDPPCFGTEWSPDCHECARCSVYHECGEVFHQAVSEETAGHKLTRPPNTTSPTRSVYSGYVSQTNTQPSHITRPGRPEGFPPGTEYLPEHLEGKASAGQRFAAILMAEGLAAGFGQLFDSAKKFALHIPSWHTHAGRRTYGENYGPRKKKPNKKKPNKKTPIT